MTNKKETRTPPKNFKEVVDELKTDEELDEFAEEFFAWREKNRDASIAHGDSET